MSGTSSTFDSLQEPLSCSDHPLVWAFKVGYFVTCVALMVFLCRCRFGLFFGNVRRGWNHDDRRLIQAEEDEVDIKDRVWMHAEHRMCDREVLRQILAQPTPAQQDNDICTVCIDSLEPEQLTLTLPCQHAFHYECMVPWMARSFSCPRCTQKMMWVTVLERDFQAVYENDPRDTYAP